MVELKIGLMVRLTRLAAGHAMMNPNGTFTVAGLSCTAQGIPSAFLDGLSTKDGFGWVLQDDVVLSQTPDLNDRLAIEEWLGS